MSKSKKGTITIQDIANKLEIASSTVSRSLNNHPKISAETKLKVHKMAVQLGYKPNVPGFFDTANRQKRVCIIVPDLQKSAYIDTISSIQSDLSNYDCIVLSSHDDIEIEKQLISNFSDIGVDGFFISLCDYNQVSHIEKLLKKDFPVILFNNVNFDLHAQKIVVDNFQGAYNAVNHLISMNCNRIALVKGADNSFVNKDLHQGYMSALEQSNIEYDSESVFTFKGTLPNLKLIFNKLLTCDQIVDAVIFSDNDMAMQFIALARNYGINVPDDLLVVCYGSEKYNEFLSPSITTIDCDSVKIGFLAVKCFKNQIEMKVKMNNNIVIPSKIVIRASSMMS
jgi:LacI family transcriptional regulator